MAEKLPKTSMQWNVVGEDGISSLQFTEQPINPLGDHQVLVQIKGAALNPRDLYVVEGRYPWKTKPNVIPGSDGAGIVLATGQRVTRFTPGDRVITVLLPALTAGSVVPHTVDSALGAATDGTLRSAGVFDEQGLVRMPECLSFPEAATLSCAGLTAWNALFGLSGKSVSAGDWVLTQGSGGVSLFAVQFAKAVGARVIATTSSAEKEQLLKRLGADLVIDYKQVPGWGKLAKEMTGGVGVDYVVEVAGTSMDQSVASLKMDGTILVVGAVGDADKPKRVPTLLDSWMGLFTVRGVWCGNRMQMEAMCRAIEANPERLRPVVDPRVFKLEEAQQAYEYLASWKQQGKVCIEID
ncbi:zinc-binding dehydrogenase [Xylariomycetidae sp. FL2044]|nr:zinc-binding dehydrogenase [Xylariomycetidae sp. FL2044]